MTRMVIPIKKRATTPKGHAGKRREVHNGSLCSVLPGNELNVDVCSISIAYSEGCNGGRAIS